MKVNCANMPGFAEIVILFHALVGLCAGWIWGGHFSAIPRTGALLTGCLFGIVSGFLLARSPGAVRLIAEDISGPHRFLAVLFAVSGVVVAITFWSVCFNCLHN
jgi:hypothetical protein